MTLTHGKDFGVQPLESQSRLCHSVIVVLGKIPPPLSLGVFIWEMDDSFRSMYVRIK